MSANNNYICACPTTAPKLYIWQRELLFLATTRSRHRAHRSVQEKLILCLEGSLSVQLADGSRVHTGSCLVPTGVEIDDDTINISNTVIAICFLAPFSQDYPALASLMTAVAPGVYIDHPNEQELIQTLLQVRDGPELPPDETYDLTRTRIIPPDVSNLVFRQFDQRVLEVARILRSTISENLTLGELADTVNLSESRLEKLFKDQAGIPITQYRLRYRLFVGALLLAQGHSVTDAALAAGFSNSAHFSRSYSATNGLAPSTTFLKPPYLKTFVDEKVLASMAGILNAQTDDNPV